MSEAFQPIAVRPPGENRLLFWGRCLVDLQLLPDPAAFLADLNRVLRRDGTLVLTVPWFARLHYLPHDYGRFTRFGLTALLEQAGFSGMSIALLLNAGSKDDPLGYGVIAVKI